MRYAVMSRPADVEILVNALRVAAVRRDEPVGARRDLVERELAFSLVVVAPAVFNTSAGTNAETRFAAVSCVMGLSWTVAPRSSPLGPTTVPLIVTPGLRDLHAGDVSPAATDSGPFRCRATRYSFTI